MRAYEAMRVVQKEQDDVEDDCKDLLIYCGFLTKVVTIRK